MVSRVAPWQPQNVNVTAHLVQRFTQRKIRSTETPTIAPKASYFSVASRLCARSTRGRTRPISGTEENAGPRATSDRSVEPFQLNVWVRHRYRPAKYLICIEFKNNNLISDVALLLSRKSQLFVSRTHGGGKKTTNDHLTLRTSLLMSFSTFGTVPFNHKQI